MADVRGPPGCATDAAGLAGFESPALLEDGEVAFGVEAVQPLLVDDRAQAAAYRVAARRWVARRRDRVGLAADHVVGERRDDVVNGAHAVGAQFEHLVQGWSRVGIVRHARVGLHLVVREAERAVWLWVAEDRAARPR